MQYADKEKSLAASNKGFAQTTGEIMHSMPRRTGYRILREDVETLPHSNVVHVRPI